MLISRLGFSVSLLRKLNRPASILLQRNFAKKTTDFDEDDKPLPYSSSPAAHWKAEYHRMPPNERVWYTPYVVTSSVMVFMLYFCVLREENDIDELIYRPLPETLPGIEKVFPDFDFNVKPDYVLYHEKKKELKSTAKESEQKTN